jgi:hypothetical protein
VQATTRVVPARRARHEVEQSPRVAAGEQDRELGDDHRHERGNVEEEQRDVMGDRQELLDHRQPLVQLRYTSEGRTGVGKASLYSIGELPTCNQGHITGHAWPQVHPVDAGCLWLLSRPRTNELSLLPLQLSF